MPALRWHSVYVRTIRSVSGTRERDARRARAREPHDFPLRPFPPRGVAVISLHTRKHSEGKTRTRRRPVLRPLEWVCVYASACESMAI